MRLARPPEGLCIHRTWRLFSLWHPWHLSVTQFLSGETRCSSSTLWPVKLGQRSCGELHTQFLHVSLAFWSEEMRWRREMGPTGCYLGSPLPGPVSLWSICKRLLVSDLEVEGFAPRPVSSEHSCADGMALVRAEGATSSVCSPVFLPLAPLDLLSTALLLLFTTTRTSSVPRELNYVPC